MASPDPFTFVTRRRAAEDAARLHLEQRRYSSRRWYPLTREDKEAIRVLQESRRGT